MQKWHCQIVFMWRVFFSDWFGSCLFSHALPDLQEISVFLAENVSNLCRENFALHTACLAFATTKPCHFSSAIWTSPTCFCVWPLSST